MVDKKNFEEYFEEYKSISESLKSDELTLEESLEKYRKSKEIYEKLTKILDQSKLDIEQLKD